MDRVQYRVGVKNLRFSVKSRGLSWKMSKYLVLYGVQEFEELLSFIAVLTILDECCKHHPASVINLIDRHLSETTRRLGLLCW